MLLELRRWEEVAPPLPRLRNEKKKPRLNRVNAWALICAMKKGVGGLTF